MVVEASVATNSFSLQAVLLTTSDNLSLANADQNELLGGGFINVADLGLGDTTSYSIGGTLMLTDPTSRSNTGAWEVGARWQDLDNADDTTILDIGVNYYIEGHNMKYILNYTSINSDAGAAVPDADLFRVGVQTRF